MMWGLKWRADMLATLLAWFLMSSVYRYMHLFLELWYCLLTHEQSASRAKRIATQKRPVTACTLYSQPLSDVISVHNCDYHKYADDTELSKRAPPDRFTSVQSCIQTCIYDVLLWMSSNKLKLNTDKTEVMRMLALHLVLSRSAVSAQTLAETVWLSKRWLDILGSILIEHCQCSSTPATFAVRPS